MEYRTPSKEWQTAKSVRGNRRTAWRLPLQHGRCCDIIARIFLAASPWRFSRSLA